MDAPANEDWSKSFICLSLISCGVAFFILRSISHTAPDVYKRQVLFHGYRREYGRLDEIVPVIFGKSEVQIRVAWQSPF